MKNRIFFNARREKAAIRIQRMVRLWLRRKNIRKYMIDGRFMNSVNLCFATQQIPNQNDQAKRQSIDLMTQYLDISRELENRRLRLKFIFNEINENIGHLEDICSKSEHSSHADKIPICLTSAISIQCKRLLYKNEIKNQIIKEIQN
ncbi:hypothetical protein GJ496_006978 [Pomphorhynchus laevis]|nr:hypothetical protein GJ496_006978 [Pomphorhynchus laevis]